MMALESEVKKLPLHRFHEAEGGRFIQFAGWEVPVYFTRILDEHECVRRNVGLFDISHMGQFRVSGQDAKQFLDWLLTNRVWKLEPFQAVYSPMLNEEGGIIDDLIVYEIAGDRFLVIANAANITRDFEWMTSKAPSGVEVVNMSLDRGILAVQGPVSPKVIQACFGRDIAQIQPFTFALVPFQGHEIVISRTGYTGEDGFEIFFDQEAGEALYFRLTQMGKPLGMKPIGFGARDTLRLEARLLLHGHDMNDEITPLECGLAWTVDFDKKDFVGKSSLLDQKQKGTARRLVGFEMMDRGLAREHYKVRCRGEEIGEVTSGSFSPTLKKNIGLALIRADLAREGSELEIIIRGEPQKAKIVRTPFYRRK